ncbi:MAG: nitroreductase family protein [Candidatus Wukongarchaeota archaeon]|nr:nitroreductase family protein [Candidatus Wukongarchaeota archaeon]
MDVKEAIKIRRAYRALDPVEITEELIKDLAESAQLAPSCFNNQPWRYVFIHDPETLEKLYATLPKTNEWVKNGSMIIAVVSKKDDDCVVGNREYYLFDTGMATAFIILRATELGLVAHPTAGYDEEKAKQVLGIPEDMLLITFVIVGKKSENIKPNLTEKQAQIEKQRPERKSLEKIAHTNTYKEE